MSDKHPLQGGAEAARRTHNPEVAGSTPAPASESTFDAHGQLRPGIYPDVDFDTYARWPAANHSLLKHFRKTPAHARWQETHQEESTGPQALGHLIHMALLEPDRWAAEGPVVAPDVDRRTKIGKATWEAFVRKAGPRPVVTQGDMEILRGIQSSAARHATAKEALYGGGLNELSIIWQDPETGVLCKGRIDRLTQLGPRPFVIDLKTTHKAASTFAWQGQVESYALHEQAAHYLRGLSVLMPLPGQLRRGYAWLVAETEPPYLVRMFEAEDAALEIGNDLVVGYLKSYAECLRTGLWPGWPEGMEIAGLPPWVYKRFQIE